ncbi:TadE family type IV pilus minor pilin [Granulicoccus phenolivorans]|uniref:TadE family type IV pilus minor pilin n=1 Tax=Granulicoccus phenolivorans TaxID=266854 RepID=UPI0003FDB9EA|nr:TadE family type IV pilus minor pilin [Granulicoccus phenolivorans]
MDSTGTRSASASGSGRGDRGMVTAELAVGLTVVAMGVVGLAWLVSVLMLQARCLDTAGETARHSARGDTAAVQRTRAAAPQGATVTVARQGQVIVATVRVTARPLGGIAPQVPLAATAQVHLEPGE